MFDNIIDGGPLMQSLVIMLLGISGVFVVLILFFLMIKGLMKIFPEKESNEQ